MIELFQMGGMLFMSILTIELLAVLFFAIRGFLARKKSTGNLRAVGLLAAITGILGQLIGLFQAFEAISEAGSVSPAIVAGGLRISMITTIYGIVIYTIALVISIAIKARN